MSERDCFKPPPPLPYERNDAESWKEWRLLFELYLVATETDTEPDKTEMAVLLTSLGAEGVRRFNSHEWSDTSDKEDYEKVKKKFEDELSGETRVVFQRYLFWEYRRSEHQPFSDCLSVLKQMAKWCDFKENDNMLRDKIVFDMQSVVLKERLLQEKDLDLTKTIDICRASEIVQRELHTMESAQALRHVLCTT